MPFRLACAASAILVTTSFSSLLHADDMEVITVSAMPVPLDDAGSSVNVITRQQILDRGSPSVLALLREIPDFAVNQQGADGSLAQLRVRGAEANQVLVLIDGIEANDPAQGSEFDFSQLNTADIERIEIVRGPQSALWGSDAMAGVVHIITRPGKAGADDAGVTANLEAGSFDTVHGSIAATYRSDRQQLKLTAAHYDTEGTNIARTGSEEDGQTNTTVGFSGRFDATPDLQLDYSARYTDKSTDFDATDFFTTGLPVDADHQTDSEYLYAGLAIHHTLGESWDHSLALHITDTDNDTDTGGTVNATTRSNREKIRYQLNFSSLNHRVSVIAEYEQEEFEQRGQASFFGDPNQDQDMDTSSIAAEYRFDGERLNLSLSARHDNNSDFDNANPWRATANYRLDNFTLHAAVGESIKNPTFVERFGFFTNFIGNADLKPEKSTQWEAGLRTTLLDSQLDLALTYFEADLEDEINGFVFDPVTFGFTADNVDGESERHGVELELAWRASESLDLRASYTYLDATQEDATGNDMTEVRRPEHTGSLSMNYRWERAGLNLAVSYTGDQQDDYFPPFPPFQERVELDAYTLVSLSGHYDISDNLTLTGRLENITDESYEQVFGYESPGFGGYLGVRLNW